jgi:integrase
MSMGRKRKYRKDLPLRVYFKHGAYHFVDRDGVWTKLDREYVAAMTEYAKINSPDGNLRTMGDVINRFRKAEAPKYPTYKNILIQLKFLQAGFGHMVPDKINPPHIYAYMAIRPAIAANRDRSLLSRLFRYAIRLAAATRNPCELVDPNPEKTRDRVVEEWERQAVYDLASPGMKGAMDIVKEIALRLGNTIRIGLADLKADGIHVTLSKGGKRRIFIWTPELEEVVSRLKSLPYPVRAMTLICNQSGQPYTKSGFKSEWRRLVKRAVRFGKLKEPFWFHDLRAKTSDESENATELLGHSDPRVTEKHYKRRPKKVKRVPKHER